MPFEKLAPGIFLHPRFLSLSQCENALYAIKKSAVWEQAAIGKYIDNEVANSFVDLNFRDVEVANGEDIPLQSVVHQNVTIKDFLEKDHGFFITNFSRLMISKYSVGSHIRSHKDTNTYNTIRLFTIVAYLNDEFSGGELFFEQFSLSYVPRKGDLILFLSEYEHGVRPITSGQRFCVVWFAENTSIGRLFPVD